MRNREHHCITCPEPLQKGCAETGKPLCEGNELQPKDVAMTTPELRDSMKALWGEDFELEVKPEDLGRW